MSRITGDELNKLWKVSADLQTRARPSRSDSTATGFITSSTARNYSASAFFPVT
jgi:hypothetical protein